MRILHITPSFSSKLGGPTNSLSDWTREQARQGHYVSVMTTDLDRGDSVGPPISDCGVEVKFFGWEGPRSLGFSRGLNSALRQSVASYDIVHIHSVFMWPTTAAAYQCRR